ncbi:uncharacterized protein LOC131024795 [Salvia miltiorrhiza]|uniref:uncharacterized protein LOC131024795 n=1 Tax=Salvia miltiorrhiza TaxID=226208 RepID=UPI0025ABEF1F|nr:uncharacterized protein LOC131024795 [Salvia miltiorrhiza]
MATAKMIGSQSMGAEIYRGASCGEKLDKMLDEFSVPRCLFFGLGEVEEFGFNRGTGFYWLKQKKKTERKVDKVGTSYFDTQLAGFIEPRRVSKIMGVKGKELFLSLPVAEMHVGVPTSDKVKFVSSTGIYRVHAIAAFEPTVKNSSK